MATTLTPRDLLCKMFDAAVEAAHPVPDEAGLRASNRTLEMVSELSADDTVVCLLSDGGSALLTVPFDNMSLADKQGRQPRVAQVGREHLRDEHYPPASLDDQGL